MLSQILCRPFWKWKVRFCGHSVKGGKHTQNNCFSQYHASSGQNFSKAEPEGQLDLHTLKLTLAPFLSSSRDDDRASTHRTHSDSERSSHEFSGGRSASYNSQSSGGMTNKGDECISKPPSNEKQQEKKQKFEARRRKHYNMREALQR